MQEGTSELINELARILKEQESTQFPLEDQKHLLLLVFRIQKLWSIQKNQYQPKHEILQGLSYFLNHQNFFQVYNQTNQTLRQREKEITILTGKLNETTNQLKTIDDQYKNLRKVQQMIKQADIQEESTAFRNQMKLQTEQFESMKIENTKLIERLKLENQELRDNQFNQIEDINPINQQRIALEVEEELKKIPQRLAQKVITKQEYQRPVIIQQPKGKEQNILMYILIGLLIGIIFWQINN